MHTHNNNISQLQFSSEIITNLTLANSLSWLLLRQKKSFTRWKYYHYFVIKAEKWLNITYTVQVMPFSCKNPVIIHILYLQYANVYAILR